MQLEQLVQLGRQKRNVTNSSDLIKAMFRAKKGGKDATGDLDLLIVRFMMSHPYGPGLVVGGRRVPTFSALSEKQEFYVDSFEKHPEKTYEFTLTEKGQDWFHKAIQTDEHPLGKELVITKVAARALPMLDEVWKNTTEALRTVETSTGLKDALRVVSALEEALQNEQARHQRVMAILDQAMPKVTACLQDYNTAIQAIPKLERDPRRTDVLYLIHQLEAAQDRHKDVPKTVESLLKQIPKSHGRD